MEISSPSLLQRRKQQFTSLQSSIKKISVNPTHRTRRASITIIDESTPLSAVEDEKPHPKTSQFIGIDETEQEHYH